MEEGQEREFDREYCQPTEGANKPEIPVVPQKSRYIFGFHVVSYLCPAVGNEVVKIAFGKV